jgi:hypothetical protein
MMNDVRVRDNHDYRAGSTRSPSSRRRLRLEFGAVAMVGGLFVASCVSGVASSPSVSPGSGVPWTAAPAPTSSVLATTGRPCAASDLTVSPLSFAGYAMGTEAFDGTVTLHAAASCDLPAEPVAAFRDASGATLAVRAAETSAGKIVVEPSSPLDASLRISDWCALKAQLRATDLTLLGGDELHAAIKDSGLQSGAPCAGSASYILTFATTSSASSSPSAATQVTVALTVSGFASRGQNFPFSVTLTNAGSDALSFDPCPVYDEGIKVGFGYSVRYELNCAAAQPIAPRASETFDMSIPIPAGAPTGGYILSWSLEGAATGANAQIEIK